MVYYLKRIVFCSLPQTKIDESLELLFTHVFQNTLLGDQLSRLVGDQTVLGEDVVVLLQHRVATHLTNKKEKTHIFAPHARALPDFTIELRGI